MYSKKWTIDSIRDTRVGRALEAVTTNAYRWTFNVIRDRIVLIDCRSDSGREYELVYFHGKMHCSCPDAVYRGDGCKHMLAARVELERLSNLKMGGSNGE